MTPATSFTQRVYDLLRASPELLTVAQLCEQSGFAEVSVRNALQALRDRKALITVRWWPDRAWRYGVNASGERPGDARGRRRTA
jgi:DNA-binding IclR family transcriptional regulator